MRGGHFMFSAANGQACGGRASGSRDRPPKQLSWKMGQSIDFHQRPNVLIALWLSRFWCRLVRYGYVEPDSQASHCANSEADHLRRLLIAEDGVERCYRGIDNKDHFGVLDFNGLAAHPSSILIFLHRAMLKPIDDTVAEMGFVGGRQHSFASCGERHRTLKVAKPQMLYGRMYLAHRRVPDASFDAVWIAYCSLPATPSS